MTELILKASKRESVGGASGKNILKSGLLPVIVYGPEKKNIDLTVTYSDFVRTYKQSGENTIVKLDVNGEIIETFIHDVQTNPLTNSYIHADFYQFNKAHKLTSEIPLHFVGESRAIKELAGVLTKDTDHVEVECLPSEVPSFIEVDLSLLNEIGDVIYVSNLKVDKNIKILSNSDQVIVSAQLEKVEKVEEAPVVEAPKVEASKDTKAAPKAEVKK